MPRPAINDSLWAEMTAAQKSEAVRAGNATLRQMAEGLLDGPDELGQACREFLTSVGASLSELTIEQLSPGSLADNLKDNSVNQVAQQGATTTMEFLPIEKKHASDTSDREPITATKRRRLGLPRGYLPRLHRHERLVRASGVAFSRSGARGGNNDQET